MKIKLIKKCGEYPRGSVFRVLEPGEAPVEGAVGPVRAQTWIDGGFAESMLGGPSRRRRDPPGDDLADSSDRRRRDEDDPPPARHDGEED